MRLLIAITDPYTLLAIGFLTGVFASVLVAIAHSLLRSEPANQGRIQ